MANATANEGCFFRGKSLIALQQNLNCSGAWVLLNVVFVLVDLARSWRHRRLGDFFAYVYFGQTSEEEKEEGIRLSGNGPH